MAREQLKALGNAAGENFAGLAEQDVMLGNITGLNGQLAPLKDNDKITYVVVNDAKQKVTAHTEAEMHKLTGGLNLPGGLKLPF